MTSPISTFRFRLSERLARDRQAAVPLMASMAGASVAMAIDLVAVGGRLDEVLRASAVIRAWGDAFNAALLARTVEDARQRVDMMHDAANEQLAARDPDCDEDVIPILVLATRAKALREIIEIAEAMIRQEGAPS